MIKKSPLSLKQNSQICLLSKWSQDPPASHLEPPWYSSAALLSLPQASQETKPSEPLGGWAGGFPFSFVAQLLVLGLEKKRN